MRLSSSAFVTMYYFAIGVVPTSSAAISSGEFSPITGKWVVAGDCDDFLNVAGIQNPMDSKAPWACGECPVGASCEYATTDADILSRFAYQRVDLRLGSSSLRFNESFHKCRVPEACLGMRTRPCMHACLRPRADQADQRADNQLTRTTMNWLGTRVFSGHSSS